MQKFIRLLSLCLLMFSTVVFSVAGYTHIAIPDEITTVRERELKNSKVFQFSVAENVKTTGTDTAKNAEDNYELNVSLFKIIPLRKTRVTVGNRRYVSLGGNVFGVKIFSSGVLVISVEDIETEKGTENPGRKAGIRSGDIIKKIGKKEVNSNREVSEICRKSNGRAMDFTIERNGKTLTLRLQTVKEKQSGDFKAGLWVRDSTAGIGTMTFFDRETGIFASLGHAICDIDTGITLPIHEGVAVGAKILGISRGTDTDAGELTGAFTAGEIGKLYMNSVCGVYGRLDSFDCDAPLIPVATTGEVKTGKAQILCTVDETGTQYYDVEITKIIDEKSEQKNMTVKITDERLLEITGGIVQGMSGTPLIQNGMLAGAITHVFIGTPKEGYAIFAENMLSAADKAERLMLREKAS
ncbi:MAG: SpoIVB peptidase [Clostridia bacterium]|nr:SpoIVB peptidase [Clostridia bacterium]